MTVPVLHLAPLDLAQNELLRLRLENRADDPASPALGRIFYRADHGRLRYWTGAWHEAQRYYAGLTQIGELAPTRGDLLVGSDTGWVIVAPGTDGQQLVADAAEPGGVRWVDPPTLTAVFGDDEFQLRSAVNPARYVVFDASALTTVRTLRLPNASGTLARREDLTGFLTGLSVDGPLTVVSGLAPRIGLGLASDGGLDDDSFPLRLRLSAASGLRTTSTGLALLPAPVSGLTTSTDGAAVLLAPSSGLRLDALGLSLSLGSGLAVDGDGALVTLKDVALSELTDVALSAPTNDQVLTYRDGAWVNRPATGGSGGSGDFSDQFLMMGA